jgi:hypothetical protein
MYWYRLQIKWDHKIKKGKCEYTAELHNLTSSRIVRMKVSKRARLVEHTTHVGRTENQKERDH